MAPSPLENGANIIVKNRSQPAAIKKIVPAIPLTYVRKRKQQQAEHDQVHGEVEAPTSFETKESRERADNTEFSSPSSLVIQSVDLADIVKNTGFKEPATPVTRGYNLEKIGDINVPNLSTGSATKNSRDLRGDIRTKTNVKGDISLKHEENQAGHKFKSQSSDSHSTYQIKPDLKPLNQPQHDKLNSESVRLPQPVLGITPTYSNETMTHCDNSESSKSSPGIAHSAVYPPPPSNHVQPIPVRCATHQANNGPQNFSHAYSPVGQLTPFEYFIRTSRCMNGALPNEFSSGQIFPLGPLEEYPSTVTQVETSRQYENKISHSTHASKPSAHDKETCLSVNNQNQNAANTNDCNGNIDDVQFFKTKSTGNTNCDPFPLPPILRNHVPQLDMFDGLIDYLSCQFANPSFADYTLELRYSDDRATPFLIPGHNLMFARSITLREMMLAARVESEGVASKTLLIETDDRFLCTNGFYMAIQRLYGSPLLDLGQIIPTDSVSQCHSSSLTTTNERFNLALGYAAAGHILKMQVIVNRGCEIAGLTLNWENLEKGLDFALDGGLELQWNHQGWNPESLRATYGPSVNIIIHKVIEFISLNFPANFQLDTSVGEARFALRLPKVPDKRQSSLNPRLSHIKFGDHSAEEIQLSTISILSRILISLPWDLLRFIFESSRLSNNFGSVAFRHQILSRVVREREKRRLEVYNSCVPNSERCKKSQEWGVIGWREEVEPLCRDDRYPKLIRIWSDFKAPET